MAKHIKELFDLSGKSAIVTGGSRGIRGSQDYVRRGGAVAYAD